MPFMVEIPKTQADHIRYPARCVACGAENPDAIARIRTFSTAWKPLREGVFKAYAGEFPVCGACQGRVTWGRLLNTLLTWVAAAIALAILLPILVLIGDRLGSIGNALLVVVGIAAALAVKTRLFAPIADCAGQDDQLVFTFRDQAYAEAFGQLNGQAATDTPVA